MVWMLLTFVFAAVSAFLFGYGLLQAWRVADQESRGYAWRLPTPRKIWLAGADVLVDPATHEGYAVAISLGSSGGAEFVHDNLRVGLIVRGVNAQALFLSAENSDVQVKSSGIVMMFPRAVVAEQFRACALAIVNNVSTGVRVSWGPAGDETVVRCDGVVPVLCTRNEVPGY